MSVKIVGLDRAVGQELTSWHFSVGAEYLLLQFTGGVCCQLAANGSSGDDPWLEESRPFCWREYDEHAMVNSGVLTAEWVATQNAEMMARREAEQRANELEILAALKAKYEGEVPVTANLFRDVLTRMKSAVSSCHEMPDNSPTAEHSSAVAGRDNVGGVRTDAAAEEIADDDQEIPLLFGLSPAAHLAQLEGMLSRCKDHPVMGPSIRQRVEQLREHIAKDLTGPQT